MKTCIKKNLSPLSTSRSAHLKSIKTGFKSCLHLILSVSLLAAQPARAQQTNDVPPVTRSNTDKSSMIQNLNKIAELEFLEGDLSKAQNTYKQITDLVLDESWSDDTRKIMFQSFFRLAQIDKAHDKEWTTKAFVFASDLEPNSKTTPQALIKLYADAKSSAQTLNLDSQTLENKVLNGSKNLTAIYKNKIYRLDILDSDQNSSTHFVRGDLIANFKPKTPKAGILVTEKLPKSLPTKTVKSINYTQSLSEGFGDKDNNPLAVDYQNISGRSTTKAKNSKRRRTWIYIASTALAVTLGAVLISNNNDKANSYESARNQGF